MSGADIREWVVPLAGSLAWPLLVLVVICVLRPHLATIIGAVRTIRFKGLEVILNQTIEEATSKAEALKLTDDSELDVLTPKPLDLDPRIAILKSWASIEAAIKHLATINQETIGPTDRMSTPGRIRALRRADLIDIDDSLVASLNDLRYIRNLIAHGEDLHFDEDALRDFSRAAMRVESIIERQLGSL